MGEKTFQGTLLSYEGLEIDCGGAHLSAEEFVRETDAFALGLARRGIGPGSKVVINMKRSTKQLIALYGTYKSGACPLPLSTANPARRVENIVKLCGAELVITDDSYDGIAAYDAPDTGSIQRADPEDAALILTTSGSTGESKLIQHDQAALYRISTSFAKYLRENGLDFQTTVAVLDPEFISSSMLELGPALCGRKQIIYLSDREKDSMESFIRQLAAGSGIEIFISPSKLEFLLNNSDFRKALRNVSVLVIGGERLEDDFAEALLSGYGDCVNIFNYYGSSEDGNVFTEHMNTGRQQFFCDYVIVPDSGAAADDEADAEGELFLHHDSGHSIYLNYPAKRTYAKDGKTYVATGDRVSRKNGRIKFLGRNDRMVKYHGLRIELDEIQDKLGRIAGIEKAAVLLSRKRGITAVYTTDGKTECSEESLRRELAAELQYYELPSCFVRMDVLPYTKTGKIDYQKLLQMMDDAAELPADKRRKAGDSLPVVKRRKADDSFPAGSSTVQPASGEPDPITAAICNAAEKVLSVDGITGNDSLIALGLDSLKAMALISALEREGISIPLNQIFRHPVISELSKLAGITEKDEADNHRNPEEYHEAELPVSNAFYTFIINAQKRHDRQNSLWIEDFYLAGETFDQTKLDERIDGILKRHPALRSVFENDGSGGYLQKIEKHSEIKGRYTDISGLAGDDGEELPSEKQLSYMEDCIHQLEDEFRAAEEPNFLTMVFRLSDTESAVYMRISHVLADGMSLMILRNELLNGVDDLSEDAFFEHRKWYDSEESKKAAEAYFRDYLKDCGFARVPLKGPVLWNPKIRSYVIDFGAAEDDSGTTPYIRALYKYGRAALKTFGVSKLAFYFTTSGRNIPVRGMGSTVDGLALRMPVVIRADDTPESFAEGMYASERHMCIEAEVLWDRLFRTKMDPITLPVFVSEILPDLTNGKYVKALRENSFDMRGINCYLFIKDGRLILKFGYNENALDADVLERFVAYLRQE